MLIVLDPGHGGTDPGAVGNELKEKDLNLDIAKRVKKYLGDYQVQVQMTREDDRTLALNERAQLANDWGAGYYISLHVNAGGGTGFESYAYHNANAAAITRQKRFHEVVMSFYRQYNFVDRGTKRANFAVLRETEMSAILLENLFIDTVKDANALGNPSFREGLAKSICAGIVAALGLSPVSSGTPSQPETDPTQPGTTPSQPGGGTAQPHWAAEAYRYLQNQGIVQDQHDLDSKVSWGELATVVQRLLEKNK